MSTHIDLSHSFKWLYSITLCEYHRNLFSYYRIMIRCKPFLFLPMLVRILAISSPTRVNVCACLCVPCLVERHKVPSPENVQISVDNQAYVLKWDYPYESTTFQAQWLRWVLFHKCPFAACFCPVCSVSFHSASATCCSLHTFGLMEGGYDALELGCLILVPALPVTVWSVWDPVTSFSLFLRLWNGCIIISSVLSNVSCSVMPDSLWPPWTVACQPPLSMEFSRQEDCSGLLFPSPGLLHCRQILYHLGHQRKGMGYESWDMSQADK